MRRPLPCCDAQWAQQVDELSRQKNLAVLLCLAAFFLSAVPAPAQPGMAEPNAIQSVSGQFAIAATGGFSRLRYSPIVASNPNLVRLEPTLLAIAAERFKSQLWQELGFKSDAKWNGKIFLSLEPAFSLEDKVLVSSSYGWQGWTYRVDLPDVLLQNRYARALSTVLLLEIANRNASPEHPAEIPAWLVDGIARQIIVNDPAKVLLSTPARNRQGVPQSWLEKNQRGLDPLISVRQVLKKSPPLTFDQLCWPTEPQLNGQDEGVYWASAQLFVHELLALKNGSGGLRQFLFRLPASLNWQTSFYAAFQGQFRDALDVEKWWALRVVHFTASDPGPVWSPILSRARLSQLLTVPVEVRTDSNALPTHAEMTLSEALTALPPTQRDAITRNKMRDLELAQYRLSPPFAILAGRYRNVLADFLGDPENNQRTSGNKKATTPMRRRVELKDTLKQLEGLEARRRDLESRIKQPVLTPDLDRSR